MKIQISKVEMLAEDIQKKEIKHRKKMYSELIKSSKITDKVNKAEKILINRNKLLKEVTDINNLVDQNKNKKSLLLQKITSMEVEIKDICGREYVVTQSKKLTIKKMAEAELLPLTPISEIRKQVRNKLLKKEIKKKVITINKD